MNKDYKYQDMPYYKPLPFETFFPPLTNSLALDFLKSLLIYDPVQRPSALEALTHPFFDDFKEPQEKLHSGSPFPMSVFAFTQHEYNSNATMVEALLLPKYLPEEWMEDIDRHAKPK
jgi:glycogen synthase kinase 3 beta